jgi:hypothetical protein
MWEDFVDRLELIIHALSKPRVIIIRGVILSRVGKINRLFDNSIIHLIDLPAIIDITPNSIVGIIMFISSLIEENELHKLGPHNTTMLNRTE